MALQMGHNFHRRFPIKLNPRLFWHTSFHLFITYTQLIIFEEDNRTIAKIELKDGPPRKTMYVTALYYTMTCMTSVGFGNIAAETDNEKIFSICMMIVAGEYEFCQCCQLLLTIL